MQTWIQRGKRSDRTCRPTERLTGTTSSSGHWPLVFSAAVVAASCSSSVGSTTSSFLVGGGVASAGPPMRVVAGRDAEALEGPGRMSMSTLDVRGTGIWTWCAVRLLEQCGGVGVEPISAGVRTISGGLRAQKQAGEHQAQLGKTRIKTTSFAAFCTSLPAWYNLFNGGCWGI